MSVDVIGPVIVAVHVNVTANVVVADIVDDRVAQPTAEKRRPWIMAIETTSVSAGLTHLRSVAYGVEHARGHDQGYPL